ncbi:hypothetical protein D3C71_2117970 [compost metagenome]
MLLCLAARPLSRKDDAMWFSFPESRAVFWMSSTMPLKGTKNSCTIAWALPRDDM